MSDSPLSLSQASCADDYDPNSMPVPQARALINQFLTPIQALERIHTRNALGRILAENVTSPLNVPAYDNSAMDGYAVRFTDLPTQGESTLSVIGSSFAGTPFSGSIKKGEAVRIMTGALVPDGADTIVMQEHVKVQGTAITLGSQHRLHQNLRRAGEDLYQGQVALQKGMLLRPAEIGLIASLGIGEVTVFRKLRVAFFSTGDELVSIGQSPQVGQIFDSNRYTIHSMLTRLGFEVLDMGVVRDDPVLIEEAFHQAAANADAVITSGGVSVGEADFVKEMLNKLGEVVFWKIAMKPGRPLAYGKIGNAHFFGLPGNPVSVMVTFYQFVRDALLTLSGQNPVLPLPTFKVPCITALKKAPGRTEFQRGILHTDEKGQWQVRVTGEQGSGILRSMCEANCFIILATDQGNVTPGSMVDVQLMQGLL
jgi:molybdopterin molybdotransferase